MKTDGMLFRGGQLPQVAHLLMRTLQTRKSARKSALMAALAAVLLLGSCSGGGAAHYADVLEKTLSPADKAAYDRSFWEANAAKAVEVRQRMNWGVSEKLFRHFVLPLRVSNEALDDFRTRYADSLCTLVEGLSMTDAVQEINHWCLQHATYRKTQGRTQSPLQVICQGGARCSEESVLVVSALRAAGIPARLAFTQRWAHIDGIHAWVEAWTGEGWHFLGACEPDPYLDIAWFNEVVARTHYVFSNIPGRYSGPERVMARTDCNTKINVTPNYAPQRRSCVKVVDPDGRAVRGARVECKVFNYGEFVTAHTLISNLRGQVVFETGYGDLLVWASKGERFGLAKIEGEQTVVTLDHKLGDSFSMSFDIAPAPDRPLPKPGTAEEYAAVARRNEADNAIRDARPHGNAAVLSAFLAAHDDDNARALLASLTEKDRNDMPLDVLEDAYAHINGTFNPLRDCPVIEEEAFKPYFSLLASSGLRLDSREAVEKWVEQNIRLISWYNPQGVRMAPADVWKVRQADLRSREIFRVALCRAMGIEAEFEWMEPGDGLPAGTVTAVLEGDISPEYYHHFTISRIENGTTRRVPVGEEDDHNDWASVFPITLKEGYYMLSSGLRLSDFGILAQVTFFNVESGESNQVNLRMRDPGERPFVLGLFGPGRFLPQTGRGFYLLKILDERDTANQPCQEQLEKVRPLLEAWGRPQLTFGAADTDIIEMFATGARLPSRELPMVFVCDGWGRILYASQGDDASLAQDLTCIIPQLP